MFIKTHLLAARYLRPDTGIHPPPDDVTNSHTLLLPHLVRSQLKISLPATEFDNLRMNIYFIAEQ